MRVALAAAAVLCAALVAGHAGASAATPGTQLRVTFWAQGQPGPSRSWTVVCRPTGGTHPDRARACRRLAALPDPFRPVPREMMCTQVFGGPEEALVTGRHAGKRVWARFSLRDGCQISRWQRLLPLLPPAGAS